MIQTVFIFMLFKNLTNPQTNQSDGEWIKRSYKISGDWHFITKDGGTYLEFGDNFRTSSGPDLKLYLTKKDVGEIGNRESVDKMGAYIAELSSHKGRQSYKIPSNIDTEDYRSLVIHCKRYSVVWGGVNY